MMNVSLSINEQKQVCKIYKTGFYTQREIAEAFNVSQTQIFNVLTSNNIKKSDIQKPKLDVTQF